MRPIAYLLAILLIVVVSAIVFFLSSWFLPTPIDSTQGWLRLAGVVIAAVLAGLAALRHIVEWIDKLISALSNSGIERDYKQKYLQHLYYRHRNFDVKGLTTQGTYTLELARVFVELSIAPRPPHEATANPIQLPQELRQGRHTIWDFLVQTEQHFAVIGPPGSGKTTLLKHMALILGDKKAQRQHRAPAKLPVLLFLRNHMRAIVEETDEQPYSLEEAVQQDLRRWDKAAPVGWFQKQLDRGRCLIMLDGLDEVADAAKRRQVIAWVDRKMQAHAQNQFIVTSRPHGYRSNPLSGVTVLEVRPFDSEQQQRFVENWYLANEIQSQQKDDEGVRMDAAEGATDLLQRLRSTPKLADLAVNPLLLTMIATVHKYRSSLPGRRVELYAEICEVFLGKRQQSKGLTLDLTPAQRQRVLQPLAWHMMERRRREIDAESAARVIRPVLFAVNRTIEPATFLKSIEQESGWLLERESGEYAFAHLTFQEYLAAAHAQDQQLLDDLLPHVAESWWHETLLLYVAGADAAPIIEACLSSEGLPDVKALLLAMACAEEAREVRPDVQQRLDEILDEALAGEDVEWIRLVSEARLRLRLQKLVRISETEAIDTSLVTCAEYQLFLDEMRTQGKYHQPDHWLQYRYIGSTGNYSILGTRPEDAVAFCKWASERIGSNLTIRLPRNKEGIGIPLNGNAVPLAYWVEVNPRARFVYLQFVNGYYSFLDSETIKTYFDEISKSVLNIAKKRFDLNLSDEIVDSHNYAIAQARVQPHASAFEIENVPYRVHFLSTNVEHISINTPNIGSNRQNILHCNRTVADSLVSDLISERHITNAPHRKKWRTQLVLLGTLTWYAAKKYCKQTGSFVCEIEDGSFDIREAADDYIQLFYIFCILEERINNQLPAFEGIRLLAERQEK